MICDRIQSAAPITSKLFRMFNLYIIYAINLLIEYLNIDVKNIRFVAIKTINNLEESFLIMKINARIKIMKETVDFIAFINKSNNDV